MADLYHLLDELDENEDVDANIQKNDDRRLTVETAVTETLSEDDGDDDFDEGSPTQYNDANTTITTAPPQIPAVLRDAVREKDGYYVDKELLDKNRYGKNTRMRNMDDADLINDDDDDDEQHVSNETYEKLHRLWLQERHCPELLDYDEGMVRDLLSTFEEREETIDEVSDSSNNVELLLSNLQQQDLDRAKFVLSDWLTQRLQKIESHPLHMRTKIDCMSPNEIEYLQAYGIIMEEHMNATVLDTIPQAWKALDDPDMIDQPDYDGYHFWFVNDSIVDKDEIDHEAGSCLVAKYLDMKENMQENKVELLI